MRSPYLMNSAIYLRACEPEDLEVMYHIENNTSLWEVSGITVPYSRYTLKQYIESSQNDIYVDKQLRLMAVDKKNNKVIGIADLTDFDPLHGRAAVGIVVLEEDRRKGYANQILQLLYEYSFNFLHLHQLYAFVPCDNEASLALFCGNGFLQCGLLKEWLQTDDGYKDAYLLQRIQ